MIKSYFKIAWRQIIKYKLYSVINVLGLALGVCACIVIYLIVSYEFSFDNFHKDKERIYRVIGDITQNNGDKLHFGKLPVPLSVTARAELPGLDAIAAISPYNAKITIPDGNNAFKHFDGRVAGTSYSATVIAQPQYFDIFKYEWLAGSAATALNDPFSVVLTESKAYQYFGLLQPDKIIGKKVVYNDSLNVQVSGIIKDWDKNTDLDYTDFISFATIHDSFLENDLSLNSWGEGNMNAWTFVKLSKEIAPSQVDAGLTKLFKKYADPKLKITPWLEPLHDIHFKGDVVENPVRTAHLPTLYSLVGVALFILILAIINFINLSTARSAQRAKEVGVRKILGSNRKSLILQFLTETFVLTVFAVVLAVLLVNPILAIFRSFIPAGVAFHLFDPSTIIFLLLVIVVTSLLAGFYPSRFLSAYLPALILKGNGMHQGIGKWNVRKALIVFQFTVSLFFIICSIVMASQLNYTRQKDLGFSADAIITVATPWGDSIAKTRVVAEKIKQLSGVKGVALEWTPPGTARGMRIKFNSSDTKETGVAQVAGNENLIPIYNIKLLAGKNLVHSDSVNEFVINENLSRMMGCKKPEDAIGKTVFWFNKPYPVVGVVADFHASSLHDPIVPLCIINRVEREGTLAVKLAAKGKTSNTLKATLAEIQQAWKEIYPAGTFEYQFYDESIALMYEKDQQTATLTNTAMIITIFISCTGLFGLAMFSAQRRIKEIGIRKVLGASAVSISVMLSRDFIVLIMIAFLVASPVAWYLMNGWLQNFAYHIKISWWVFATAASGAILIGLITISFQAIKAAVANPVKSLRTE